MIRTIILKKDCFHDPSSITLLRNREVFTCLVRGLEPTRCGSWIKMDMMMTSRTIFMVWPKDLTRVSTRLDLVGIIDAPEEVQCS
jgi:hypothetical protein